jgi:hypothetical protein
MRQMPTIIATMGSTAIHRPALASEPPTCQTSTTRDFHGYQSRNTKSTHHPWTSRAHSLPRPIQTYPGITVDPASVHLKNMVECKRGMRRSAPCDDLAVANLPGKEIRVIAVYSIPGTIYRWWIPFLLRHHITIWFNCCVQLLIIRHHVRSGILCSDSTKDSMVANTSESSILRAST